MNQKQLKCDFKDGVTYLYGLQVAIKDKAFDADRELRVGESIRVEKILKSHSAIVQYATFLEDRMTYLNDEALHQKALLFVEDDHQAIGYFKGLLAFVFYVTEDLLQLYKTWSFRVKMLKEKDFSQIEESYANNLKKELAKKEYSINQLAKKIELLGKLEMNILKTPKWTVDMVHQRNQYQKLSVHWKNRAISYYKKFKVLSESLLF